MRRARSFWLRAGLILLVGRLVVLAATGLGVAAPRSSFGTPRRLLAGLREVQMTAAGGTVWVAGRRTDGIVALTVLDARTGAIRARRVLGAVNVDDLLIAQGWLWLTIDGEGHGPAQLLRLAPDTLAVLSRVVLATRHGYATVASAGGSLWVGDGGELDRVTAIGGQIVGRIRLAHVAVTQVATGPAGRSLLVSVGDGGGVGHVQRRDPVSGALRDTSWRFLGVTNPQLGGTIRDDVWISEATGMAGYVQQLSVATLRPTRATLPAGYATNGIHAQVIDGILWVAQTDGRPAVDYCADPLTGRRRASLPAVVRRSYLLTADASRIYFVTQTARTALMSLAIPAACR